MANNLNRAEIIGHLGQDPEIRSFQNGGKVANLSVATGRSWKDRTTGEKQERTDWHRVAITSEGLAGIAERFLKKGSKVYIAGRLRTRKWQDQSGQDRYTTEIVVAGFDGTLEMLGDSRGGSGGDPGPGPDDGGGDGGSSQGGESRDLDDEIPF